MKVWIRPLVLLLILIYFINFFIKNCLPHPHEIQIVDNSFITAPHVEYKDSLQLQVENILNIKKLENIKAIEHIYRNAWVEGANAVIAAKAKGITPSPQYLDILRKSDSTKFSNDFRNRNK